MVPYPCVHHPISVRDHFHFVLLLSPFFLFLNSQGEFDVLSHLSLLSRVVCGLAGVEAQNYAKFIPKPETFNTTTPNNTISPSSIPLSSTLSLPDPLRDALSRHFQQSAYYTYRGMSSSPLPLSSIALVPFLLDPQFLLSLLEALWALLRQGDSLASLPSLSSSTGLSISNPSSRQDVDPSQLLSSIEGQVPLLHILCALGTAADALCPHQPLPDSDSTSNTTIPESSNTPSSSSPSTSIGVSTPNPPTSSTPSIISRNILIQSFLSREIPSTVATSLWFAADLLNQVQIKLAGAMHTNSSNKKAMKGGNTIDDSVLDTCLEALALTASTCDILVRCCGRRAVVTMIDTPLLKQSHLGQQQNQFQEKKQSGHGEQERSTTNTTTALVPISPSTSTNNQNHMTDKQSESELVHVLVNSVNYHLGRNIVISTVKSVTQEQLNNERAYHHACDEVNKGKKPNLSQIPTTVDQGKSKYNIHDGRALRALNTIRAILLLLSALAAETPSKIVPILCQGVTFRETLGILRSYNHHYIPYTREHITQYTQSTQTQARTQTQPGKANSKQSGGKDNRSKAVTMKEPERENTSETKMSGVENKVGEARSHVAHVTSTHDVLGELSKGGLGVVDQLQYTADALIKLVDSYMTAMPSSVIPPSGTALPNGQLLSTSGTGQMTTGKKGTKQAKKEFNLKELDDILAAASEGLPMTTGKKGKKR